MDKNLKIIAVSAVVLFFIVFIITSNSITNNYPDYTVYSTNKKGTALLFDTLKNLGYSVKISRQPIHNINRNDLCIVIEPNNLKFDDYIFDMLDWSYYGGNLMLLTSDVHDVKKLFLDSEDEYFDMLENIYSEKKLKFYDFGEGSLILGSSDKLTNESLAVDRKVGYELAEFLSYLDYENIYFNEYYHGYLASQSFFKDIPFGIKLVFYQFLIVIVLVIIYLGKCFGKPIPYHENEERIENEYIIAVANLYQEAGLYDVIIENYYYDFINRATNILNQSDLDINLLNIWKQKKLPHPEYVSEVQDYIYNKDRKSLKGKKWIKQFNNLVSKINYMYNTLTNVNNQWL